MKILAIDTSGSACSAALMKDGKLLGETVMNSALTHSETIMPAVEAVLEREDMSVADVDLIAVVAGPGSFTGVRIGVCAAKALCQGAGKKCARIDALEALAYGTSFEGLICPILDARRGQVYTALFRREGKKVIRMWEDDALPLEEMVKRLPSGQRVFFTGDGVPVNAVRLTELMGENAVIPAGNLCVLRAGAACVIAERDETTHMDPRELNPIYLRLSQAERERSEKLTRAKV